VPGCTQVFPIREDGTEMNWGLTAPRIRVADVGGEKFDVAPAGGIAGVGDQRRHQGGGVGVDRTRDRGRSDDRGELVRGVRIEGGGSRGADSVIGPPSLPRISRMINDVIMREMGAKKGRGWAGGTRGDTLATGPAAA
jgi:hypothetical protein